MISRPVASCGACSMCCFLMAVPDIDKPACLHCEHELRPHGGCRIYDQPEKPEACSDFKCLWLVSQGRRLDDRMPSELRPDRAKAMFHDARDEDNPNVLYVHVHPDYPGAWLNPSVKSHVDLVLGRGCSVHVIVGMRRIVLEPGKPPVSGDDGAAARTALRQLVN